jgi:hypothetical protein
LSERGSAVTQHWDYELESGALLHSTMQYAPGPFTVETWLTELE